MKTIESMTDQELVDLTDKIKTRLEYLLPEDAHFIMVLGSQERHMVTFGTFSNLDAPQCLRGAAELIEQHNIERN